MSLFAIGDLHLHYQSVLKAKDQLNSPLWADHEERFAENCRRLIEEEDTLVLVGDHSWGRNLEECEKDFEYIKSLPGRKILTRGNHDMFWDAKKTAKLNDLYYPDLTFLQDAMPSIRILLWWQVKAIPLRDLSILTGKEKLSDMMKATLSTQRNLWNGRQNG